MPPAEGAYWPAAPGQCVQMHQTKVGSGEAELAAALGF